MGSVVVNPVEEEIAGIEEETQLIQLPLFKNDSSRAEKIDVVANIIDERHWFLAPTVTTSLDAPSPKRHRNSRESLSYLLKPAR